MGKRSKRPHVATAAAAPPTASTPTAGRPSALLDTRVVYCGDNLEQLAKLPDRCVDLIDIDPPFNLDRNYEIFWRRDRTGAKVVGALALAVATVAQVRFED